MLGTYPKQVRKPNNLASRLKGNLALMMFHLSPSPRHRTDLRTPLGDGVSYRNRTGFPALSPALYAWMSRPLLQITSCFNIAWLR